MAADLKEKNVGFLALFFSPTLIESSCGNRVNLLKCRPFFADLEIRSITPQGCVRTIVRENGVSYGGGLRRRMAEALFYHYSLIFGYIQAIIITLFLRGNGGRSVITFEPLWDMLKQRGISQYALIKKYGVSTGTLDALRKNRSITLNTLNDLCNILQCEVLDVIRFIPDKK